MRNRQHKSCFRVLMTTLLLPLYILLAVAAAPALAQSGGEYDLTWSTVDSGGEMYSAGGAYTLGGTAGQPDPGLLTGGGYALGGGFWGGGAAAVRYGIYLPLLLRDA